MDIYVRFCKNVSSKFQSRALSSKLLTGISTLLASNIAYKYENFTSLLKILLPLESYQRVITAAQYRVYLFIQRLQTRIDGCCERTETPICTASCQLSVQYL